MNIGVYLDFDNIWGGLLRELGIDPKERKQKNYGLIPTEIETIKELLKNFLSDFLYSGLRELFSQSDIGKPGKVQVRYVKAFAVFSKLPFAVQIGDIQNLLHNFGTEPFPSFIAQNTKDASDRILILEVIEDVFFNRLPIDTVVIGSGDIDFYPLVSFFYEHSDKNLYILSFKNSLNSLYKELPLTKSKILDINDLKNEYSKFCNILMDRKKELKENINEEYEKFKKLFSEKFLEAQEEGRKIKTGLLFSKWLKDWKQLGYKFDNNEVNLFLDYLQKEELIEIKPDNESTPLNGEITMLKQLMNNGG
jgi:hypothetical protein